ncbi:MAG: elongation factor 4 [Candidatus Schekmanbacteria bacterium]|nr:elongation factor 4 [Candidatus Schekmanbacteria bacterium]
MELKNIRNFSIIAHIDHGKSTLADRILEYTGTISPRNMQEQVLDGMDLERERGITIKAKAVRLDYQADDGQVYEMNLIDTPGHVDFTYEVSRALAACEGVLLLIDATQGVQAQTLANFYLALENDLTIIPLINKVDLYNAEVDRVKQQLNQVLDLPVDDVILTSGKTGIGTKDVLEAIVKRIPAPKGAAEEPLKALIFDSIFDPYQGVVVYLRILEGKVFKGLKIKAMAAGTCYEVNEVGVFKPAMQPIDCLTPGEVGYVIGGIKNINEIHVGDTITSAHNPTTVPFAGYKQVKPMVFSGLYPINPGDYEILREALEKLKLNDASLSYEPENSSALGFGFRCGFLGMLHMEIVQERLEREFDLSILATAPTVNYKVTLISGEVINVQTPTTFPDVQKMVKIEEPMVLASIILPAEFLGGLLALIQEKRGVQKEFRYLDQNTVLTSYNLPLNEMIIDFYDRLKSLSRGYASFDYEPIDYQESKIVKLEILINGQPIDALSCLVFEEKAYFHGRDVAARLRKLIPRQLFEVAIQATMGGRIIARETVKALGKNVTAKCYGGDITRKRKLWEKQKEGKKRMKQVGKVTIPQDAFMAMVKRDAS